MGFPFTAYLASLAGTRTKMNTRPRFSLALPVLAEAHAFAKNLPGCRQRRSSEEWTDVFGYAAHLSPNGNLHKAYNHVGGNTDEFKTFHDETRIFAQ
jgi:hypothetical protein